MVNEKDFPEDIYWITGQGRSRLYASKKAVRCALPDRRRWGGFPGVRVWLLVGVDVWRDVTHEFITDDGVLAWR